MANPLNYAEITKEPFFGEEQNGPMRLLFGSGMVARIGREAAELGKRALLVTDPGIVRAGHVDVVRASLEASGLAVSVFDKSIENPTASCVDSCVAVAKDFGADIIVGLGGGSSMDTAKGCNFVLTNGGVMKDYWGVGKATMPMLPLIAVPTTAGTGSECQSFALISDDETHAKMACGDKKALPALAILDPDLTVSQPFRVTACTGIDALAHALEAAVTRDRNETSARHARLAFLLVQGNLEKVFVAPDDVEARGFVQMGASHAGSAIESSMLGAAHSMANPLTARRDVVHGNAVGLCLPAVMRFNAKLPEVLSIYAGLARSAGLAGEQSDDASAFEAVVGQVEKLLRLADFPLTLEQFGFSSEEVSGLAQEASGQWTAGFNPRSVSSQDFAKLYSSLFAGTACASAELESSSNKL